jgi:hypothetical protein
MLETKLFVPVDKKMNIFGIRSLWDMLARHPWTMLCFQPKTNHTQMHKENHMVV